MKYALLVGCLLALAWPSMARAQFGMGGEAPVRGEMQAPIVIPRPRVAFDVLNFRDRTSSDSTRVDLYLAVPYRSLQFLYSLDKYIAEYSVSVQISNGDDPSSDDRSSIVRDVFESYSIREPVSEYHAHGMQRADAEQLSFHLPAGSDYHLHLTVSDEYGHRNFDTSFAFRVTRFPANRPAMSDLLLYRDRVGMNIVPSIGPDVSSLEAHLTSPPLSPRRRWDKRGESESKGIFAELYNMPSDATLGIVTEVLPVGTTAERSSVVFRSAMSVHTPEAASAQKAFTAPSETQAPIGTVPLFVPLDLSHVWPGVFELRTYILPLPSDTNISDPALLAERATATARRTIRVQIAEGVPTSLTDLDQAIEQLRIIATSAEWDSLSHAHTPEGKQNAILEFWSKKQFSSGIGEAAPQQEENRPMEIFYSRLEYANEHFGSSFDDRSSGAGWKSDRGHVYIALGTPDRIDDHPQSYNQTFGRTQPPYQEWHYSRVGMSYVFVDEYGLGDYRLRGAFPPEGTFQY